MSGLLHSASTAAQSAYAHTRSMVRELVTESHSNPSDGYSFIPSYGSTSHSEAPATLGTGSGLQRLGPDPTKIEPKVWLASERTFLNWLRVALLISSFGLALFNASASAGQGLGKWMGIVYMGGAVGMVGYAYAMHRRRRHRIIYRFAGHHGQSRCFASLGLSAGRGGGQNRDAD